MKNDKRPEYVMRDRILKLLSDDEVGRVSTAETAAQLTDGDEYVDLEALGQGVRRALGTTTAPMGRVLPRKAVSDQTWRQIIAMLGAQKTGAAHLDSN